MGYGMTGTREGREKNHVSAAAVVSWPAKRNVLTLSHISAWLMTGTPRSSSANIADSRSSRGATSPSPRSRWVTRACA
jgi:hypothetical protein